MASFTGESPSREPRSAVSSKVMSLPVLAYSQGHFHKVWRPVQHPAESGSVTAEEKVRESGTARVTGREPQFREHSNRPQVHVHGYDLPRVSERVRKMPSARHPANTRHQ